MSAIIDLSGPINFSNPETYLWLFILVIGIPALVGSVLGIVAAILDEWG